MRVLAARRRPNLSDADGIADRVYGPDEFHEMLGECDYVLCAAPLTPQTKYMFNRAAFKAMKPSAVFINIGRGAKSKKPTCRLKLVCACAHLERLWFRCCFLFSGPVCEEAALVEALKTGEIRGAALDVFEKEPLPEDSELWSFDNLLFSPHNADLTESCRVEATQGFVDLVNRRLAGESIDDFLCNKKAGY